MYMQKFKIVNLSVTQKLAFKIKTTSPKQYIVRPKTGIIPPNSFLEIEGMASGEEVDLGIVIVTLLLGYC